MLPPHFHFIRSLFIRYKQEYPFFVRDEVAFHNVDLATVALSTKLAGSHDNACHFHSGSDGSNLGHDTNYPD
jgi:hypothetical protein